MKVLPAASFAEKDGTFTNFEWRIQQIRKAIEPVGDSLPDGEIVMRLSHSMRPSSSHASSQQVMEEIEEMVPFYRHYDYSDVNKIGVEMDEIGDNSPGTKRLYKGIFPSGFGRFTPVEYIPPQSLATDGYPFTLMTGSSRYHFGTGARSSRSARLKRFSPEAFLEINPADAGSMEIRDGDKVKVISAQGNLGC